MSQQSEQVQKDYELEPDVDEDLAEKVREYSMRKDGRYVEAVVTEIKERNDGRIKITAELPGQEVTEIYETPSPDNKEFEEIANEYGLGLVDIGSLYGEKVWCTKESGEWRIVVRKGKLKSIAGKVRGLVINGLDNIGAHILYSLFSPIIALDVKFEENDPYKQDIDQELINFCNGILYMCFTILTWVFIYFMIHVIFL